MAAVGEFDGAVSVLAQRGDVLQRMGTVELGETLAVVASGAPQISHFGAVPAVATLVVTQAASGTPAYGIDMAPVGCGLTP